MNKKKSLSLLVLFPLLTACRTTSTGGNSNVVVNPVTFEVSRYSLQNEDEMYNKLYNRKNKIEIVLDFSNESLRKLQEYGNVYTIQRDMYHPCQMTLKINDETFVYDEVGARMKGNTSRTNGFVFDDDTLNKGWFLNLKLSFNQTFDDEEDNDYYIREWESKDAKKERKNRRLGGQKKIDLKWNKNFDYTFTRAAYASYIYEEEGIPSQKDNIVKMTIKNEKDQVTFLTDMMEAVDETFLLNHFEEDQALGNLYKCAYKNSPADLTKNSFNYVGIETPSWTPVYDLKTNDKEPDHSLLENFINIINDDKRPAEEFKDTLEEILDVDEFIRFSALSWVIGNPDDMRNNYNNYYLYFRSDTNKMVAFQYDLDRCFGILKDWEIHTENYWYSSSKNIVSSDEQVNPLFYRAIIEGSSGSSKKYSLFSEYKSRYEAYCYHYAHKYLDVQKFQEFTNQFPLVNKDVSKSNRNGNLLFKTYCEEKLKVSPSTENLDYSDMMSLF